MAVLAIGLLIAASFASSMTIFGVVDSSGTTTVDIRAELPGMAGQTVYFNFTRPLEGAELRDRSGLVLPSTLYTDGNTTQVSVVVPYDFVELQTRSDEFTSKNRLDWNVSISPQFSERLDLANATIDLPASAVVLNTTGYVFEGRDGSLDVAWHGSNINASERMRIRATYQLPVDEPNAWEKWVPLAIGGLLVLAAGIVIWKRTADRRGGNNGIGEPAKAAAATGMNRSQRARSKRKSARKTAARPSPAPPSIPSIEDKPLFSTLEETDKEIVREIVAQGGRTTQAHLHLYTHVPKATLSRHLASLENRELLERVHKGNRKLVRLTGLWQK